MEEKGCPLLVIVTGPPCTGKTSLGQRLAEDLHLPFLNKDGIKELLFDRLGWKDRAWSRALSYATYDILYYLLESLLQSGSSLVVESNFKPANDNPRFKSLHARHRFYQLQVVCRAEPAVILQRCAARAASGERHPGHVDHLTLDEVRRSLEDGDYAALDIGGQVIDVDTTDFGNVDYLKLLTTVRLAVNNLVTRGIPQ
ncbi:MAG TPA: AAA family ATPase [Anaerolineales bacterium]|nr:AAA family ATPase [Anaerolineales bacterium]